MILQSTLTPNATPAASAAKKQTPISKVGQLRPLREQAPQLYQETPIGWLPKAWVCAEIKKFVSAAQYGISESLNSNARGIPVLRMNNIQDNRFDVTDLKYSVSLDAKLLTLKHGDVLYNRTNSMEHVGKIAILRNELPDCSFASYLVRIHLHVDLIVPEYFSYWMSQKSAQNALRAFATPAVQQVNINPTNLQRILTSVPSDKSEQKEIVRRITAIDSRIQLEQESVKKLQKQKSGLMHDLLTGKKPVTPDPEN